MSAWRTASLKLMSSVISFVSWLSVQIAINVNLSKKLYCYCSCQLKNSHFNRLLDRLMCSGRKIEAQKLILLLKFN